MKLAVMTSGGDAPGMNAAIHGVCKSALSKGHEVLGIERGYEGLLDDDMRTMTLGDVDGISRFGGTILGSARSTRFRSDEGQALAAKVLRSRQIDGLVVIGGNGSITGLHKLARHSDVKSVGIPASIDNDVGYSRLCIGTDTAVNTIVEACDKISDTARAHRRAFIVEVMGRHCGYLAMRAGLAASADAILFAERERNAEDVLRSLEALLKKSFDGDRSKGRVLIVKAEGVKIGTEEMTQRLNAYLEKEMPGVNVRSIVLGHVVRGGRPSATCRVVAKRLGYAAVVALEEGKTDVMAGWESREGERTLDPSVMLVPLKSVIEETERLKSAESPVTAARVALLSKAEGILAL